MWEPLLIGAIGLWVISILSKTFFVLRLLTENWEAYSKYNTSESHSHTTLNTWRTVKQNIYMYKTMTLQWLLL